MSSFTCVMSAWSENRDSNTGKTGKKLFGPNPEVPKNNKNTVLTLYNRISIIRPKYTYVIVTHH